MFGAPRYADVTYYSLVFGNPAIQVQRIGDIVPYVPFRKAGYADHPCQLTTELTEFTERKIDLGRATIAWRFALFMGRRCEPHFIRKYREEIGKTVKASLFDQPLVAYEKLRNLKTVEATEPQPSPPETVPPGSVPGAPERGDAAVFPHRKFGEDGLVDDQERVLLSGDAPAFRPRATNQ